ncbi:TerD family protein [Acanthopleuribacter pedis]|uniref:TerD family protein n=1 Tax=Acanthopleuribacter pedis TaxID=442870 RepID=A0A8J7U338_9BACT|nr:TerD family protein [Acanthopleuribacter pedis]MBO1317923.1 TerD family protein [Acanthopleuribacter pedis]
MNFIALKRLFILSVSEGPGISTANKCVLQAELASMGYRLTNPELLDRASETFFLKYRDTMNFLKSLRGGDVDYVPLFTGFPDQVPEDNAYFARRVMGYLGNRFDMFEDGTLLESGIRVPEWLFDLNAFGADPITQFQVNSLWEQGVTDQNARETEERVQWIDLELVFEDTASDRLRDWLRAALYANASVKEEWHDDLSELLTLFGAKALDPNQIAQKENLALVMRLLWREGYHEDAAGLAQNATDLLRLFAALTDSNISLATKITFPKFSRPQRRAVLGVLEKQRNLAEDLNRYRGLWLEIGRYLHVSEFHKTHPHTHKAFDLLRNGKVVTFNSKTEKLIADGLVTELLHHLEHRPGVLARKLHELLRRFPKKTTAILAAFERSAASVTAKNLLVLLHYFQSINESPIRTVVNKRGKMKVLENNAVQGMTPSQVDQTVALIREQLTHRIAEKESWVDQSVWIDPDLEHYIVPLQQRAASDGLLTFGRGSQIPIDEGKVLRLFVYWKQTARTTDLDLSLIQFDETFVYRGHVSYTNLASDGIVHSGDLQSAPRGAAEFIDVTLDQLPKETRYLAIQVYRFAGEAFAEMQAHAGWMVRKKVSRRYRGFDIKSVVNKFDLNGTGSYCVPLVVDLKTRRAILTDLYMGTRAFYNNVEGECGNVAKAVQAIVGYRESRPNLKTLAEIHLAARQGEIAQSETADIRFGVKEADFNAHDTATILADLL